MHDTMKRMHGGPRPAGTTLTAFRLNALVTAVAFGGRRRRVYRTLVTLSGTRPGDTVLDVGCSTGYLARMLAVAAGSSGAVTGVDPAEAALAYARRRGPAGTAPSRTAPGAGSRASTAFVAGVAQDLSAFADGTFDVVTSSLALHHVPARRRPDALREMYRVTRPGGRLLVADFDPARRVAPLHRGAVRMQHAAASTGPLEELAAAAGYRVERRGTLPLLRYVTAVRDEPAGA